MQSAVSATHGLIQWPLFMWKYWLPHSHKPLKKCGEMIKAESIGIALMSEVSEKSLRTGFRSQTEFLKEASGLPYAHFFSSQKLAKFMAHEGNAMLSSYPLSSFASHLLPKETMRMALEEAVMDMGGKKVTVFLAHMALTRHVRLKQLEVMKKNIKSRTGPIILAGDFNEKDRSVFDGLRAETRLKQLYTAKTFPAWKPRHSFDYILLSEEFKVHDFYAQKQPPFSDHLAFIVKAELE